MRFSLIAAALAAATLWASAAAGAEGDLSEASPAELQQIIREIPDNAPPGEPALRRAEAMYRLGDLQGDMAMIRAGADLSRRVLNAQEAGSHGALWVAANKNLGTALVMLARRSGDPARLDEAIQSFDAAVVFARDSVPGEWPGLINSLAIAQWTRGKLTKDAHVLRKGTETFREALNQDAVPLGERERMRLEVNLASALVDLSTVARTDEPLDEAVTRLDSALARVANLDMESQKAIIEGNLGQALTMRGWTRKSIADLERAVTLIKQAITYWASVGATDAQHDSEANLRQAHHLMAELYNAR
jgi:tetratricopeptide (TPR) repeat protein